MGPHAVKRFGPFKTYHFAVCVPDRTRRSARRSREVFPGRTRVSACFLETIDADICIDNVILRKWYPETRTTNIVGKQKDTKYTYSICEGVTFFFFLLFSCHKATLIYFKTIFCTSYASDVTSHILDYSIAGGGEGGGGGGYLIFRVCKSCWCKRFRV